MVFRYKLGSHSFPLSIPTTLQYYLTISIIYRVSKTPETVATNRIGLGLELLLRYVTDPADGKISASCVNLQVCSLTFYMYILCVCVRACVRVVKTQLLYNYI